LSHRIASAIPRTLAAVVLGAALLWCRTAAAQDSAVAQHAAERNVGVLRPGDALKIAVYQNKDLSGEYLIDSHGIVQIPGLGDIQAAGLNPEQVRERLKDQLVRRGNGQPEIAVQPLIRVSVLGEVRLPNLYSVDPGTSLIQLLTLAGGPTDHANLERARVVRDGRAVTVDLKGALSGSASGRVLLYSNDVLVVPARTGFTRENVQFIMSFVLVGLSVANLLVNVSRR
jgi:protein involved in polysaccharide export with SLBB domain